MNPADFDEGLQQILVCTYGEECANAARQRHGSENAVFDALKTVQKSDGLNRKLSVLRTSCQGWCEAAPVCTVWPEGKVIRDVTPEGAAEFVKAVLERDESVLARQQVWDLNLSHADNLQSRD